MRFRYTDKCVGCYQLQRTEVVSAGARYGPIVYECLNGRFPYLCALSGLLRPSVQINMAARDCPKTIEGHCIICSETKKLTHYGPEPLVYICRKHDKAWGTWLDKHPGKRDQIAPRGRAIRGNWIEAFREFIEDMRRQEVPLKEVK